METIIDDWDIVVNISIITFFAIYAYVRIKEIFWNEAIISEVKELLISSLIFNWNLNLSIYLFIFAKSKAVIN